MYTLSIQMYARTHSHLIYFSVYPTPQFIFFLCLQIPSCSVRILASIILNICIYWICPPVYNQSPAFPAPVWPHTHACLTSTSKPHLQTLVPPPPQSLCSFCLGTHNLFGDAVTYSPCPTQMPCSLHVGSNILRQLRG